MADFTVRSDHIDVEQIMRQIRARIRDKRGADYTEAEIRELANVKLDKFLDPRAVRSDLLLHYRQQRRPANEAPMPLYAFDPSVVYVSDRGTPGRILTFIRKLLNPILKLFFNPTPMLHVMHLQTQINDRVNKALVTRDEFDALNFEMFNNLVVELTRLGVEVRNLRMQVESFGTRLDFDERRARALEGAVQYKPGAPVSRPAPPAPAAPAASASGGAASASPGTATSTAASAQPNQAAGDDGGDEDEGGEGEGRARRRRRRRGRRRGQGAQGEGGEGQVDAAGGEPRGEGQAFAREPRGGGNAFAPAAAAAAVSAIAAETAVRRAEHGEEPVEHEPVSQAWPSPSADAGAPVSENSSQSDSSWDAAADMASANTTSADSLGGDSEAADTAAHDDAPAYASTSYETPAVEAARDTHADFWQRVSQRDTTPEAAQDEPAATTESTFETVIVETIIEETVIVETVAVAPEPEPEVPSRFTRVFDDESPAPHGTGDAVPSGADAPADQAASGSTESAGGAPTGPDDSEPSRS